MQHLQLCRYQILHLTLQQTLQPSTNGSNNCKKQNSSKLEELEESFLTSFQVQQKRMNYKKDKKTSFQGTMNPGGEENWAKTEEKCPRLL